MGPEIRTGINGTIPDPEMDTRLPAFCPGPVVADMSGRTPRNTAGRLAERHVAKSMNW